ncbi:MAG: TIGR03842 family LLM class F420-dependent oxidoreductase [Anaerolineae bacterium]|nr:TIGR03842 family LLM class F420-dependent oxidoreductase [Anaerolineae bacterium]
MARMDFGITFKSDMDWRRELKIVQQAEAVGFKYVWSFDSHVLWQAIFPRFALWAYHTKKVHIGPLVTNPVVRDVTVCASDFATLQRISGGRMELGIGRGDSSRRRLGKPPTTMAHLEEFVEKFRKLTAGEHIDYDGADVFLSWADSGVPPVWVAGYGPIALRSAGRIADGVVLQFADPHLIKWCLQFVKEGAEEAGRDYSQIKIMACAPIWIGSDLEYARERVRWFPALVSNHVVDLLKRYGKENLPPELVTYVETRKGYDYLHHAEVGSSNAEFVPDEIVDRYCVIGTIKDHIAKLEELQSLGVHQFNIYLMCGDEEKQVAAYGRYVIPHFNGKKHIAVAKTSAKKAAKRAQKTKAAKKAKTTARKAARVAATA